MYLVSACLMGRNCKYNGGNNRCSAVLTFLEGRETLEICPETAARLPRPRPPAEYAADGSGKIVDREGCDVTQAFVRGAQAEAARVDDAIRRGHTIEGAILKARSPSCGCGVIYDGTFSGGTIAGDGCFTALMKVRGIKVISEEEVENDCI